MLPWTKIQFFWVPFSPGNAVTDIGCGGKLNGHLMASCVGNIPIKKLLKSENSILS